jgi:hypothetical protein
MVCLGFGAGITHTYAQDSTSKTVLSEEVYAQKREEAEKKSRELIDKILDGKKPAEVSHFYKVFTTFNLLETVEMVKKDVGKAVKSCGQKNPDLNEKMTQRLAEWQGKIDPPLRAARDNLNNMIAAQDYAAPETIREVFKILNDNRTLTAQQTVKEPVTTPEACTFLYDKMTETEAELARLMNETLVNVDQAFSEEEPSGDEAPESQEKSPSP